jgi:hypothetical protein
MARNPITGRLVVDALLLQLLLLVLAIWIPFSTASSDNHDASHSSTTGQTRMRGGADMSLVADATRLLRTANVDDNISSSSSHRRAQDSAIVTCDKTQYYVGELIVVNYTMSPYSKIRRTA